MKLTTGSFEGQQWDNHENRTGFTRGGRWHFFPPHLLCLFFFFSLVLYLASVGFTIGNIRRYLDPTEVAQLVQLLQPGISMCAIARDSSSMHCGLRTQLPKLALCTLSSTVEPNWHCHRIPELAGSPMVPCAFHSSEMPVTLLITFGGGSMIIWWDITMNRDIGLYVLGNKTLTAIRYHNLILRPIVWPYSAAVGPWFFLVCNNTQPLVARVWGPFLENEEIDTTSQTCCIGFRPPRFPDLNPVQHLWDDSVYAVRLDCPEAQSRSGRQSPRTPSIVS